MNTWYSKLLGVRCDFVVYLYLLLCYFVQNIASEIRLQRFFLLKYIYSVISLEVCLTPDICVKGPKVYVGVGVAMTLSVIFPLYQ